MRSHAIRRLALTLPLVVALFATKAMRAEGDLTKVKHIIIVMQENHSFDNYFGALAYAPGSPYHNADRDGDGDRDDRSGCRRDDHRCVDGLSCAKDHAGNLTCFNSNIDDDATQLWHFTIRAVASPQTLTTAGLARTTKPTSIIRMTRCCKR